VHLLKSRHGFLLLFLETKSTIMRSIDKCIEACLACATECENCATACLSEENVKMLERCILLDRECAAVCYGTAKLMAVGGENLNMLCNVCADICDACADECDKHSEMHHCKLCADACRSCAEECRQMIVEHEQV
jgi:hypothetical protein